MSSKLRYAGEIDKDKCVEIIAGLLRLGDWDEQAKLTIIRESDPLKKGVVVSVCGAGPLRHKCVEVKEGESWLDAMLSAIDAVKQQRQEHADWPPMWIAGNGSLQELTETT
jgi:hypothetical protein